MCTTIPPWGALWDYKVAKTAGLMLRESLLEAAGWDAAFVEESLVSAMCATALLPGGFAALQREPLHLSRFAAARVCHATRHACSTRLARECLQQAAADCRVVPPELDRLRRIARRAGVNVSDAAFALALLWMSDAREAFEVPPHKYLLHALNQEVRNVRHNAM